MTIGVQTGLAPELFTCDRQNMRLTVAGCSRLWLSTQEKDSAPKPWEGRLACVTCAIGAANSGQTISPVADHVAILGKFCPRCLRASPRRIKRRLCVSCYNRQAEADKGRNAKGSKPRLGARLRDVEVVVCVGEDTRVVDYERVTGAAEAIISRSQRAESVMAFGWSAAGPGEIAAVLA